MGFFDLFKSETEREKEYREFLESKSKEFISILPNKITEEYVSYDLSQFYTIDQKIDFLFIFLKCAELYGPYSRENMKLFFNKEYSKIHYFFYDISEKDKEYLKIFEDGRYFGFKNVRVDIKIYENKIDFRLQEVPKDDYENDYYDDDSSNTYDRGSFLFQKTHF